MTKASNLRKLDKATFAFCWAEVQAHPFRYDAALFDEYVIEAARRGL